MAPLTLFALFFSVWQLCLASSLESQDFQGVAPLTVEELKRLENWSVDDLQNIWELSGQIEGDMILDFDQRNGLIDEKYRWPNGELPIQFDSAYTKPQKQWIIASLRELRNSTCIKLRNRKPTDKDYVYVTPEKPGCFSSVGRKGGKQVINLAANKPGKGCLVVGTVIHEFLHTLGFVHQHSSSDRDNFIEIQWDNIIEDKKNNFKKRENITSFGEPYDYESVMHYGFWAFSKNGEKTIVTKDPYAIIGQREFLSYSDIDKVKKMYNCPK